MSTIKTILFLIQYHLLEVELMISAIYPDIFRAENRIQLAEQLPIEASRLCYCFIRRYIDKNSRWAERMRYLNTRYPEAFLCAMKTIVLFLIKFEFLPNPAGLSMNTPRIGAPFGG